MTSLKAQHTSTSAAILYVLSQKGHQLSLLRDAGVFNYK